MRQPIPGFLSHLRRDHRGIPVPWINLWGSEDVNRLTIRPDRYVRRPGVFLDDSHETDPDFTRQNMQRQRQAMAGGLCQVCGRPVSWPNRFLVIAGLSVEWVTHPTLRRQVPVVVEPWLDEACARFALDHCPALIRRSRDEQLTLRPIRQPQDVELVCSTGWIEGPLEAESRRVQPAFWVKARLLNAPIRKAVAVR